MNVILRKKNSAILRFSTPRSNGARLTVSSKTNASAAVVGLIGVEQTGVTM